MNKLWEMEDVKVDLTVEELHDLLAPEPSGQMLEESDNGEEELGQAWSQGIQEARRRQSWTVEEAAARLGISRQRLLAWEAAEGEPTAYELIQMSRVYQTLIDDLLMVCRRSGGANPPTKAVMEPRHQLAARLLWLRQRQGWNRKQAAGLLQLTQTALRSYEKGERIPSLQELLRVTATYEISMQELLSGAACEMTAEAAEVDIEKLLKHAPITFHGISLTNTSKRRLLDILTGIEIGYKQQRPLQ